MFILTQTSTKALKAFSPQCPIQTNLEFKVVSISQNRAILRNEAKKLYDHTSEIYEATSDQADMKKNHSLSSDTSNGTDTWTLFNEKTGYIYSLSIIVI